VFNIDVAPDPLAGGYRTPTPGCDHDRTGTVTAPVDPSGWTYV